MLRIADDALTFDDVLLLPAYSNVLPSEVLLETRLTKDIRLNIPLMSAAMDTVTEARLAIAVAQEGGIGIVHKNMDIEAQAREQAPISVAYDGERLQPVYALIDVNLLDSLNQFLQSGDRKIDRWYAQHDYACVDFSTRKNMFGNINRPEDRQALLDQMNQ